MVAVGSGTVWYRFAGPFRQVWSGLKWLGAGIGNGVLGALGGAIGAWCIHRIFGGGQ